MLDTGGDPDKIESMREVFKKGYAQAREDLGRFSSRDLPRRLMMLLWRSPDKLGSRCRTDHRRIMSYSRQILLSIENHVVPMPQNASMYNMVFLSELYQARPLSAKTFCPGRNSSLSPAFNSLYSLHRHMIFPADAPQVIPRKPQYNHCTVRLHITVDFLLFHPSMASAEYSSSRSWKSESTSLYIQFLPSSRFTCKRFSSSLCTSA